MNYNKDIVSTYENSDRSSFQDALLPLENYSLLFWFEFYVKYSSRKLFFITTI